MKNIKKITSFLLLLFIITAINYTDCISTISSSDLKNHFQTIDDNIEKF
ncbi:hypothetical protein [Roseburia sp. 499]|nr:hypothetical protein [Roseburia sp. 499]WVK69775.1 hypothetical protein BIV20_15740 [Roseburia sp. 499]